MTQNEHVYAIYYWLEAAVDDVISVQNIKTVQGYMVVNFEGTGFNSTLRYFPKRSFSDNEVGDGSGRMNAICSRPEVPDDVTSGRYVDIFRCNGCVNLRVAILVKKKRR